jgi:hypothetical protein
MPARHPRDDGRHKSGDMRAADLVLQRIWPARKSRPVTLTLPAIGRLPMSWLQSALADAVGADDITPDGQPWRQSWRPSARQSRQWIWKAPSALEQERK